MKLSKSYFYTLRENVKDEDSTSGNLLVRAGMIKKSSSGIYMIMPMGKRVLKKIEEIVREEMDAAGAQELLMPAMIPEEIYEKSGRREAFGSNMFALKDRYQKNYVLGPTHEELFTMAAMMKGSSYKDFPYNLYQIAAIHDILICLKHLHIGFLQTGFINIKGIRVLHDEFTHTDQSIARSCLITEFCLNLIQEIGRAHV